MLTYLFTLSKSVYFSQQVGLFFPYKVVYFWVRLKCPRARSRQWNKKEGMRKTQN